MVSWGVVPRSHQPIPNLDGGRATGQLTDERDFLITSHNRALASGAATAFTAQNPNGPRGLLIAYRDELANPTPPPQPQPLLCNPKPLQPP